MSKQTAHDAFTQQALTHGFSMYGIPKSGFKNSVYAHDDGHYQNGYPKRGARFVDNGDGTITDRATGLMWIHDVGALGGVFGSAGNPSMGTYDTFDAAVAALSFAGHSDWRIPNVKEFVCLMDFGVVEPMIDHTFFPHAQAESHWTSTPTVVEGTSELYTIDLYNMFKTCMDHATGYAHLQICRNA